MPEDPKPEPPAPAPWTVGGVPIGIVKGGTARSSYERDRAEADADTRRRQDEEAAKLALAKDTEDVQHPRIHEMRMVGRMTETPRLVWQYMNRDKTVAREGIGEITFIDDPEHPGTLDMTVALVCPRCLARGEPQWNAQMLIRSSNRKIHLDDRSRGIRRVMTEMGPLDVLVAGTVSCDDMIRCKNYNCDYRVRIEQSRVWEV